MQAELSHGAVENAAPTAKGRRRVLDWRIGGVLLGLLVTAAVALQGPIGVSTAYVTTDALAVNAVAPQAVGQNAYLSSVGAKLSAEWLAVAGMAVGALLASVLSRSRTKEKVPSMWRARFGPRTALRFAAAFAGGFLILFGARLAGGCTSGHVISGMSQLALSGAVFAAAVFSAGIPTALFLYRSRR